LEDKTMAMIVAHEAAHVVVGHRAGFELRICTIDPDEIAREQGYTLVNESGRRVDVALASFHDPLIDAKGSPDDRPRADDWILVALVGYAHDRRCGLPHVELPGTDYWRALQRALQSVSDDPVDCRAHVQALLPEAELLLDDPSVSQDVIRVAEALARARTLRSADIKRILIS
jgi:hypothetical protein